MLILQRSSRINKKHVLLSVVDSHIINYPTPSNLNYMWSFGSLAGFCFVIQIITGVFLAMHYTPHLDYAFASVEYIMRDVNYGWLIRYLHANSASLFFLAVYFHLFRGIYYGSYLYPRRFLWASGIIIFFLMMATAFIGYVLPWGQMSFWGATVITNLFSAIPYVGSSIVEWLWGGFSVDNATLNRFYSFHYLLPFITAGVIIAHLGLLHESGSNNPLGVYKNTDVIRFHGYFFVKDFFGGFIVIVIILLLLSFNPNILGHPDNYIPANPLVTPAHIVPEWYFLPFYAILRSVPNKLGGVVLMVSAILVLLTLPLFNRPVIRIRRDVFKVLYFLSFWLFFLDFLLLGWIGQQPVDEPYTTIGFVATQFYFFHFLGLVPIIELIEAYFDENYN